MKKALYLGIIVFVICMFSRITQAQKDSGETEVLAYILPDSLEMPGNEKGQIGLGKATIKSETLGRILSATGLKSIGKAFPNWDEKDSIGVSKSGLKVRKPNFHRVFSLRFNTEKEADLAIEILKKLPAILYAEKNIALTFDNDPQYINGTQWYLNNNGANGGVAGADVNAEAAWTIFTGSRNSTIAIFDTGVDQNHEEFQGRVTGDAPLGEAHGTMVAGVAGARGNNGLGIRGLDWNALIRSHRISDLNGSIGDAGIAQKISDAVGFGTDVMNHSWSTSTYSTTLASAFAYANKMNMVAVATMGNTFITETRYPGGFDNVISVGATNNAGVVTDFSTRGNHIDVVAPGGENGSNNLNARDIFTTMPGNNYGLTSGTSFSAPLVSGLASLLKGFNPSLANDDVTNIIRLSAIDIDDPGFDIRSGFGRIDAGRALNLLRAPYTVSHFTTNNGTITSSTGNYQMLFLDAGGISGTRVVRRHEVRKTITFPQSFCHIIGVWGRGVGTNGWNQGNPNYGEGFTEVVPGTLTATGVTLRTFVYETYSPGGQYLGYSPGTAGGAIFQYTVLGIPGTPPQPVAAANPGSINLGGSATLTATGCAGNITWSTGQTGNSITVSPTQTTSYTATCSQFSCPNSTSNPVSVTVSTPPTGGFDQCVEAESSSGNGAITSDPNASNGQTRGEQNNYNHYVDYAISNVPSSGTYTVTLRYYSSADPVVSVQANGGSAQTVNLANSLSWNIVATTQTFNVTLNQGSNTIRIQGIGGGSCRQDKICVTGGGGGNPPSGDCYELRLASNQKRVTNVSGIVKVKDPIGSGNTQTWKLIPDGSHYRIMVQDGTSRVLGVESGGNSIGNIITLQNSNGQDHQLWTKQQIIDGGPLDRYGFIRKNSSLIIHSEPNWGDGDANNAVTDLKLTDGSDLNVYGRNKFYTDTKTCPTLRMGVEEAALENIPEALSVSPNPNAGEFEAVFYLGVGKAATLSVINILGQTLYERGITGQGTHTEKVKLGSYVPGIFLVQLRSGKNVEVKKIIVVR